MHKLFTSNSYAGLGWRAVGATESGGGQWGWELIFQLRWKGGTDA